MPLETPAMRCQSCGQAWQLTRLDEVNLIAPKFCPACGSPTLKHDANVMLEHAACFAAYHPKLVQLLYQTWRLNPDDENPSPMQRHQRFIDYIAAYMEE